MNLAQKIIDLWLKSKHKDEFEVICIIILQITFGQNNDHDDTGDIIIVFLK